MYCRGKLNSDLHPPSAWQWHKLQSVTLVMETPLKLVCLFSPDSDIYTHWQLELLVPLPLSATDPLHQSKAGPVTC